MASREVRSRVDPDTLRERQSGIEVNLTTKTSDPWKRQPAIKGQKLHLRGETHVICLHDVGEVGNPHQRADLDEEIGSTFAPSASLNDVHCFTT